MTTVTSPRMVASLNRSSSSPSVPRCVFSNFFVSSMQTAARRVPVDFQRVPQESSDAERGFVEDKGVRLVLVLGEKPPLHAGLPRREPLECEARRGKTRGEQGSLHRTGAGNDLHLEPLLDGAGDEPVPRVADAGVAGAEQMPTERPSFNRPMILDSAWDSFFSR